MNRPIDSIENIPPLVTAAGRMALEGQRKMDFSRRKYKRDGSVLTETDLAVEHYLLSHLGALYPQANLLAEETAHLFDQSRPFTLAIDPIDGSDVFSQGMAGWCVSVGLLDQGLQPIAGVVYAPRLDLLIFADVGRRARLNGDDIDAAGDPNTPLDKANIMVSSRVHREIDLSAFPGKIRNVGSGALHFCFPLIHPGVIGAVQSPVHIWDMSAAHAINRSAGFSLQYLSGESIDYSNVTDGRPVADFILSGSPERIDQLRKLITKI